MTARVVLGVDPGGRETGFVVRRADELVAHVTVVRVGDDDADGIADPDYVVDVGDAVHWLCAAHCPDVVAVEDLVHPTPHMGIASVVGVLGAATALGSALLMATSAVGMPEVVTVRPGGHGRAGQAAAYPRGLHDPHGCNAGTRDRPCSKACVSDRGKRRHERAAWDIAHAGRLSAWQVGA